MTHWRHTSAMLPDSQERRAVDEEGGGSRVVFQIVWKEKSENFTRQCCFFSLHFFWFKKFTKTNFEVTWGLVCVSAELQETTVTTLI